MRGASLISHSAATREGKDHSIHPTVCIAHYGPVREMLQHILVHVLHMYTRYHRTSNCALFVWDVGLPLTAMYSAARGRVVSCIDTAMGSRLHVAVLANPPHVPASASA